MGRTIISFNIGELRDRERMLDDLRRRNYSPDTIRAVSELCGSLPSTLGALQNTWAPQSHGAISSICCTGGSWH